MSVITVPSLNTKGGSEIIDCNRQEFVESKTSSDLNVSLSQELNNMIIKKNSNAKIGLKSLDSTIILFDTSIQMLLSVGY